VVESAKRPQAKYGVPGAILAGMAIHESGYGRTRLAILSNNLLSFKLPTNPNWQFGRPSFVLWCQPEGDVGNKYLLFGSKEAAFDYVAKVLADRADLPYAAITQVLHMHGWCYGASCGRPRALGVLPRDAKVAKLAAEHDDARSSLPVRACRR
jgi:hypothetical protein